MMPELTQDDFQPIWGTYKVRDDCKEISTISSGIELKKINCAEPPRMQWRCRREFLLACIAGSLGSANLWKFPFVAKENGGGVVFLIAYLILTVCFAMPMCLVESILAQYSGMGTIKVWNLSPISKGIGISNLLLLILILPGNCASLVYNAYYIVSSFTSLLPWSGCFLWWGADNYCNLRNTTVNSSDDSGTNMTFFNWTSASRFPAQAFLINDVLKKDGSEDISHLGNIQWQLFICLLFAWMCIFLCVCRGIRSVGHVVTIVVPTIYTLLVLLTLRVCFLDGGLRGILSFFVPQWGEFLNINMWLTAAQQLVFGLGISTGAKAAFASHNVFHHKIQIDAWILWAATTVANIIMSLFIYGTIGALAAMSNTTVDEIPISESFRLTYHYYPEVVANSLKVPQIWSFIFYSVQLIMKIAYNFLMVLVIYIAIQDVWPSLRKRQTWCISFICFVLFLLSLPSVTHGGYYVSRLINDYTYVWVAFIILLCEEVSVCFIYGVRRFISEMGSMAGLFPCLIFKISWTFLAPLIILTVIVMYFFNFDDVTVGDGHDGESNVLWASIVGWLLPTVCLLPIPVVAAIVSIRAWLKGDVKKAFVPTSKWKPNIDLPLYWK